MITLILNSTKIIYKTLIKKENKLKNNLFLYLNVRELII